MLVIDDDSTNLMGMENIFNSLGIEPYLCNNGEEAVKIFQKKY